MNNKIKDTLQEMGALLKVGGDHYSSLVINILNSDDEKIWSFLVSNELWGGSGSIADQALLNEKTLRMKLEKLLIELGEAQIQDKKTNARTEMWVTSFKKNK